MSIIISTQPDRTEERGDQGYFFYFANGKDPDTLPNGAEYNVVYSPSKYNSTWHAASFKVVRNVSGGFRAPTMVNGRLLEADEIPRFEQLLTEHEATLV